MGRVLAVANMKGGVGKTTVTINLGAALAERGQRLLLVDMDPQSNLSIGLGIDVVGLSQSMYDVLMDPGLSLEAILLRSEGLTVAPAHLNMVAVEVELAARIGKEKVLRKKLAPLRERFDVILIDCPPSLGLLTINALAAADAVVVPIQGQYYALYGVTQLMRTVHLVREELNEQLSLLGVVVTLLGRTKLAREVLAEVERFFGQKLFATVLHQSAKVAEAPTRGQSILAYEPHGRSAAEYRQLAEEVLARCLAR